MFIHIIYKIRYLALDVISYVKSFVSNIIKIHSHFSQIFKKSIGKVLKIKINIIQTVSNY